MTEPVEKVISVTLPKGNWKDVIQTLMERELNLLAQSSQSSGLYKEVLDYEAFECQSIAQTIQSELEC